MASAVAKASMAWSETSTRSTPSPRLFQHLDPIRGLPPDISPRSWRGPTTSDGGPRQVFPTTRTLLGTDIPYAGSAYMSETEFHSNLIFDDTSDCSDIRKEPLGSSESSVYLCGRASLRGASAFVHRWTGPWHVALWSCKHSSALTAASRDASSPAAVKAPHRQL